MEDAYEYMQRLDREQHAKDVDWNRHIVCVGLNVIPIEEHSETRIIGGKRVAVNYWTEYAFNKEVARQTGPIRHIDPKTGLCTEIVHRSSSIEQRTDSE